MRPIPALALTFSLVALPALAQDARQIERMIEGRHGLMTLMAYELGKLGGMAKEETPYDAEVAGKAASNLSALASVISPELFPKGSAVGEAEDSEALPAIWEKPDDFAQKISGMEEAAAKMQAAAGTDLASLQGAMRDLGAACGSCHETYRQKD
ncbi:cytochrome c [Cereibacter sphaeroides]|uniref:c-type cytochrome n=1 Tax=Cereibacter sphaeroides TaxID=1063 RepID=UPI000F545799|nr:cytochrome c [Cereibacter sphaeroides]AZB55434.1 cytochrome c [Cereibacter sphaeroides]AZB59689.1 cytochrome c [Cereibacter sphaeroides]AZB63828.1 cytochrome c [Cereibacter sphaeroides]AZB68251.1 cytochrome c [Cereibacter sphaeroides]